MQMFEYFIKIQTLQMVMVMEVKQTGYSSVNNL